MNHFNKPSFLKDILHKIFNKIMSFLASAIIGIKVKLTC